MAKSPAELLAALSPDKRDGFLKTLSNEEAAALLHQWRGFLARPEQLAPDGDWDTWLALAGRGFGKTRLGSEWIREEVAKRPQRIALVAETAADARDVMVEGDSGILSVYPSGEAPIYEPSKRRLTWSNGSVATLFNATEPSQLRGPQFDLAWCDELAKWRYAQETWDMLQFGLRLGSDPRSLVTTTPRPIQLIKDIVAGKEGVAAITRGSTMDNASNLASKFLSRIQARYAGTRLGRQELNGEILGDLPGALWRMDALDLYRATKAPDMDRILVSIDPAVTNTEDSDAHGIIVGGISKGEGYVLEDASLKGSPFDWARAAVAMVDKYQADGIVVEVNQGGDMVKQTIMSVRPNANVYEVRASRGKHVRAEPIAALYEQGRIHHVGFFPELEGEMTQMTSSGYEGSGSPDRTDSLVWLMAKLFPDMAQPVDDFDYDYTGINASSGAQGWMGV